MSIALGGNRRVKKPKGFLDNLQVVHDPKFRLPKEIEEQTLGADKYPLWAGPRGWQTACHNPTAIDAILTGKPYPVRAMYVSGANIVVTYPNTPKTVDALRSLDFLMVASDTMTPTAELADIVLPKTTALEEDDIRLQPGGPLITMTQVAVPARGEARNDLEIALGLYEKMQARGAVTKNFLPWKTEDEFIEYLLGDSGVTLDMLRRDGYAMYPYTLENFEKFPSPTGKLELYSEAIASVGVDPLPNFVAPARDSCRRRREIEVPAHAAHWRPREDLPSLAIPRSAVGQKDFARSPAADPSGHGERNSRSPRINGSASRRRAPVAHARRR